MFSRFSASSINLSFVESVKRSEVRSLFNTGLRAVEFFSEPRLFDNRIFSRRLNPSSVEVK